MTTQTKIDVTVLDHEPQSAGAIVSVNENALLANVNTTFAPATAFTELEVQSAMEEVDLEDTNTITRFGFKASEAATSVSQEMIGNVRNKDSGPVGEIMNDMMGHLRGLDATEMKGGGFFGWLTNQTKRVLKFSQQFEKVSDQIESMKSNMITHQTTMMTSVAMMDRLYTKTEEQFHALEVYIVAGERLLDSINTVDIPAMAAIVDANRDGEDGTPAALMPQKYADLQNRRDVMERKVHDLKLVRMVTLQALPKIRLTQDSDNNLISKIDSIVTTTIPIWYQEMAIAIEQAKTQKAAEAVSSVADATEEMLTRGADAFQKATLDARRAVERSVVGIEAVKYQNQKIIETIDEAAKIAVEGKKARAEAEATLVETESALREALKRTKEGQATITA